MDEAPQPTNHIMVDLETLSLQPDAVILSIGAVRFSLKDHAIYDSFHQAIDIGSSLFYGQKIDGSTLEFWLDAERAKAREEIMLMPKVDLFSALDGFAQWLGPNEQYLGVWSNGASFDLVVLKQAYRRAGIDVPWRYDQDRCLRTIKNGHPKVDLPDEGTKHSALDDARYQARYLLGLAKEYPLLREHR